SIHKAVSALSTRKKEEADCGRSKPPEEVSRRSKECFDRGRKLVHRAYEECVVCEREHETSGKERENDETEEADIEKIRDHHPPQDDIEKEGERCVERT